jgi:uncharacterized protein YjbI with pentapeptide repeats
VRLERADMKGVNAVKAKFNNSDMARVVLIDAQLQDADFSHVRLERADFSGSVLNGANFDDALLHLTIFSGANLEGARGLKREQLATACGDEDTKLPQGFEIKQCPEGLARRRGPVGPDS